jgi:hypothetical protein
VILIEDGTNRLFEKGNLIEGGGDYGNESHSREKNWFDLLHKSADVRERLLRQAYCALSSALLQEVNWRNQA